MNKPDNMGANSSVRRGLAKISVLILVCIEVILAYPNRAVAFEYQNTKYLENSLLNDVNFIANADVYKKVVNGTYVYEFIKKDKSMITVDSDAQKVTSNVAQVIAYSEAEAVQVEQIYNGHVGKV